MFERLQNKWKVGGLQFVLILFTFAIGGSLTGYAGKKLMNLLSIDQRALWVLVYILMVTLIWPLAVLLVSIPFGQFRFFTAYLKKMGRRMGIGRREMGVNSPESGVRRREADKNEKSKPGSYGVKIETVDRADPASGIQHPVSHDKLQSTDTGLRTLNSGLTTRIAIFASGAGSNAQKIINHFKNNDHIKIALVVCNKPGAGVLSIAANENIPSLLIDKEKFFRGNACVDELKEHGIGFIVLAGFLWKVPDQLINAYPGKIINIHPALLPNYGGKGMYGNFVHEAVINAGENESGITIHYVDGHYDNGDIIFQAKCPVLKNDSPASLAARIHQLEHKYYPQVIEDILDKELKEKKS